MIPSMQVLAKEFAVRMASAGIPFMFTCTYRSSEEQSALYAQGRINPGRIVTWTLKSKHCEGKAFDIAILKDGKPTWDVKVSVDGDTIPDYEEAGKIGEALGLVWGGRWKTPDCPHFQVKE
ncbi:MAG: M15 family metallopeptidase [Nitrospirales bacterium]|nr:M15 family metallopeptidase [Nitrospirales bacterium]